MSDPRPPSAAEHHFALAGGVALGVRGVDAASTARIAALMDPYPARSGPGDAGIVLEQAPAGDAPVPLDIQGPARDDLMTASDGRSLHVLQGRRWCTLPDETGLIRFGEGFPLARLVGSLARPALQLALAAAGAPCVHSACVDLDGGAVVVAGWSETGKTETALAFLEDGARFVSDKWTVLLPDGTVGTFPIGVGIRRWVLPHLPTLRSALPSMARAQLRTAGGVAALTGPIRRRGLPGRIGGLAVGSMDRAIALADRAALSPSQVGEAYGHPVDTARRIPLRATVILTTVPGGTEPTARIVDPGWAARRLARSAAYERRGFGELLARARYAFPDRPAADDPLGEAREERLLAAAFSAAPVIEARAPFPADPRRVAAVIGALL